MKSNLYPEIVIGLVGLGVVLLMLWKIILVLEEIARYLGTTTS